MTDITRRGFLGALSAAAASLIVPRKRTYFFDMGLPLDPGICLPDGSWLGPIMSIENCRSILKPRSAFWTQKMFFSADRKREAELAMAKAFDDYVFKELG